jgi:hypothetical protein
VDEKDGATGKSVDPAEILLVDYLQPGNITQGDVCSERQIDESSFCDMGHPGSQAFSDVRSSAAFRTFA